MCGHVFHYLDELCCVSTLSHMPIGLPCEHPLSPTVIKDLLSLHSETGFARCSETIPGMQREMVSTLESRNELAITYNVNGFDSPTFTFKCLE